MTERKADEPETKVERHERLAREAWQKGWREGERQAWNHLVPEDMQVPA